jgi:hypothetical protein
MNTLATATFLASITDHQERLYAHSFAHWIAAGVGELSAFRHAAHYDCGIGRERTAEIRAAILNASDRKM